MIYSMYKVYVQEIIFIVIFIVIVIGCRWRTHLARGSSPWEPKSSSYRARGIERSLGLKRSQSGVQ